MQFRAFWGAWNLLSDLPEVSRICHQIFGGVLNLKMHLKRDEPAFGESSALHGVSRVCPMSMGCSSRRSVSWNEEMHTRKHNPNYQIHLEALMLQLNKSHMSEQPHI